jgi:hypothetical protein
MLFLDETQNHDDGGRRAIDDTGVEVFVGPGDGPTMGVF